MPASDQGILPGRYMLTPRTLIFLQRGEELLLIQGAPNKRLWAGLYNGIGGHIERGEDALSAARRELLEETGLCCADLRLAGVVIIDAGQERGVGLYVFFGEQPEGEARQSAEGALHWVSWERALSLPLVEDLQVLLPRLRFMQPGQAPFSALYRYDENGQMLVQFAD